MWIEYGSSRGCYQCVEKGVKTKVIFSMNGLYNLHFWFSKDLRKYLDKFYSDFDEHFGLNSMGRKLHSWCNDDEFIKYAVQQGHLKLLKYQGVRYYWHSDQFRISMLELAAQHGHLHVIMWIQQMITRDLNNQICSKAAESNQLEVLKWAGANGGHLPEYSIRTAAEKGHLSIIQYVIERRGLEYVREALEGIEIEDMKIEKLVWVGGRPPP